jgi:hypothetical protein
VNPIAKFPPSLVAAGVAFLAVFLSQTVVKSEAIELGRTLFPSHDLAAFQNCVSELRQNWVSIRSVPQFARFEAINKKYEAKYHCNFRDMAPGSVPLSHCSQWWFS